MWRGSTEVLIIGAILLIGFGVVAGGLWQRYKSPASDTATATTSKATATTAPREVRTVEHTVFVTVPAASEQTAAPAKSPEQAAPSEVGYVVESCNVDPGKAGRDIHWWPRPSLSTFYECVHRVGSSPIVLAPDNPYCALSPVDGNIGCSTARPISRSDLMN